MIPVINQLISISISIHCFYLTLGILHLKNDPGPLILLMLDGNSEIGAHVLGKTVYLICLKHLFRWTAFAQLKCLMLFSYTHAQRVIVTI